jgi:hypothetical protein
VIRFASGRGVAPPGRWRGCRAGTAGLAHRTSRQEILVKGIGEPARSLAERPPHVVRHETHRNAMAQLFMIRDRDEYIDELLREVDGLKSGAATPVQPEKPELDASKTYIGKLFSKR